MGDTTANQPRRVAAVTGGTGAIGSAIVEHLRRSGHTVEILDLGHQPPCDLADAEAVRAHAGRLLDEHGHVDVLVHAAAAFDQVHLDRIDLDVWRRVQAVNVESALLLASAFAPPMRANGFGRIVFVVSDTVWAPPAGSLAAYVASKSALIGLARTLATEWSPDGIAVTCVAPGLTPTPSSKAGMPAAAFDAVVGQQRLKRSLVPDDVAATVAFLAGDAAAALTGQTICVDGGLVLR